MKMNGNRPAFALAAVAAGTVATGLPITTLAQDEVPSTLYDAFQMSLEEAPPGMVDYDSAEAIGDEGLEIQGLRVTSPDGDVVSVESVVVDRIEVASIVEDRPPQYLDITVTGLVLPQSALEEMELAGLGYEELTADINIDWEIDSESMSLSLNEASFDVPGMGLLTLDFSFGNVAPNAVAEPMMLMAASIASAHLSFDDDGLMARIVEVAAAEEGKSEEEVLQEIIGGLDELRAMVTGEGGGDAAIAGIDQIEAFVSDYASPKGPLTIAIEPQQPVPLAMFADPAAAATSAETLNASITYGSE